MLERLVIRRGRSEDEAGAAVAVYGGELELRSCVVEGARTGAAAGRGGAVVNKGGSVSVRRSVFRDNDAGAGKDFVQPGDHLYHYAGSLYVDGESSFDGARRPVNRASSEVSM